MTLSVLWRSEGRLHIASDSRITLGNNKAVDVGIKVLAVPVRIIGEITDPDNPNPAIYNKRFGFCFSGSLVNAYTFKEMIEEILQNIQYTGEPSELSFIGICEILKEYSSLISTEITSYMYENGQYAFFLSGFCPLNNRLEAVKFSFMNISGKSVSSYEVIAEEDKDYVAIGSGATKFENRISNVSFQDVLLTINKVIDEKEDETVGGDIQYGTFSKNCNFSISGIHRKSLETATVNGNSYGPSIFYRSRYRGFLFFGSNWDFEKSNYHIFPSFIELTVPSNEESNNEFIDHLSI